MLLVQFAGVSSFVGQTFGSDIYFGDAYNGLSTTSTFVSTGRPQRSIERTNMPRLNAVKPSRHHRIACDRQSTRLQYTRQWHGITDRFTLFGGIGEISDSEVLLEKNAMLL